MEGELIVIANTHLMGDAVMWRRMQEMHMRVEVLNAHCRNTA
jgi:hypothetical protein